jgi:pimeloyl-ACP methyl ester carboxylesterase
MLRSTLFFLSTIMLLLPTSLFAQQTPETPEPTLTLGDETSGSLEIGERISYPFDAEGLTEPYDIILFSEGDIVLTVNDAEGSTIGAFNDMGIYGNEVFSWVSGDRVPAEIEVNLYSDTPAGDYSLAILPTESHISETPVAGEQVKRWTEVAITRNNRTRTFTLPNLLYLPEDYDEQHTYPLVLFLHGAGEAGPRLDFLKAQVMARLVEEGEDFPFIIASPQLGTGVGWAPSVTLLAAFIEQLETEFSIDPDRVYVMGLSLGGSGVWSFALEYPDIPAAIVSAAGFYYGTSMVPDNICNIANVPMWVIHSRADEVVGFEYEEAIVNSVEECGGEVEFVIYEDANHSDTFEPAFTDPGLYDWLLQQHR